MSISVLTPTVLLHFSVDVHQDFLKKKKKGWNCGNEDLFNLFKNLWRIVYPKTIESAEKKMSPIAAILKRTHTISLILFPQYFWIHLVFFINWVYYCHYTGHYKDCLGRAGEQ